MHVNSVFLDLSVLARQVHTLHGCAMGGDAGPELRVHDSSLPAAGGCGRLPRARVWGAGFPRSLGEEVLP